MAKLIHGGIAAIFVLGFTSVSMAACSDPVDRAVNWSNCKLNSANLRGANLSDADVSDATWTDGRRCYRVSLGACN
jgi:uncharacterized protein YjbI with pentapeptide repeats